LYNNVDSQSICCFEFHALLSNFKSFVHQIKIFLHLLYLCLDSSLIFQVFSNVLQSRNDLILLWLQQNERRHLLEDCPPDRRIDLRKSFDGGDDSVNNLSFGALGGNIG